MLVSIGLLMLVSMGFCTLLRTHAEWNLGRVIVAREYAGIA